MNMATEPKNIDINPDRIFIEWPDSTRSEFKAPFLRGVCQCANCVSEVTGQLLIDRTKISDDIKITRAEPMGNYAVSFAFSDQHSTGIYSYVYLRSLAKD